MVSRRFPNGNTTLKDTDFWEVYGKLGWEVIKDKFAVGANVYYSPSWLNTGADGLFASATAKVTLPSFRLGWGLVDEVGWYISGEAGYYWLGTTDVVVNVFGPATTCLTMPPGTSASPSPGRLRPSTCATTTPTSRRAIVTLLTGDPTAGPGVATIVNPTGNQSRGAVLRSSPRSSST